MYKTLGVKWFCQVFSPASAFATADSDEARNPQCFIHVTVVQHFQHLLMKIKCLVFIGFLSLSFGNYLNGQNKLIDITSNSEEGFKDLIFNIIDKQLKDDYWIIIAKGQLNDTIVGFKLKIRNELPPGIVNGEIDKKAFIKDGVEFSSIGEESENFIKILSSVYGFKTSKSFSSNPVIFTCFSLNNVPGILDKGNFKFKLFYDDANQPSLYSEIYLNTDFQASIIELPEKDPGFRENLIKVLTR